MSDADIIDSLGGVTKLASQLGYDKARGGVQRVQNWKRRGIPAKVRLMRPDIFGAPAFAGAIEPGPAPSAQGVV